MEYVHGSLCGYSYSKITCLPTPPGNHLALPAPPPPLSVSTQERSRGGDGENWCLGCAALVNTEKGEAASQLVVSLTPWAGHTDNHQPVRGFQRERKMDIQLLPWTATWSLSGSDLPGAACRERGGRQLDGPLGRVGMQEHLSESHSHPGSSESHSHPGSS